MPRALVLVLTLVSALLAVPPDAALQPAGKVWLVGVLADRHLPQIDSLREALRDLGYVEGRNLRLEYRWAAGRQERFPALAADLVQRRVDAIVTWGTPAALAAKNATTGIPIVMGAIGDPIGPGVVSSLARPGGNITGMSSLTMEIEAKRVELLKASVPGIATLGVVTNPSNPYHANAQKHVRSAAQALDLKLHFTAVEDPAALEHSLEAMLRHRPDALVVMADLMYFPLGKRIAAFALKHGLPSVSFLREHAEAGVLLGYAPDYHDMFRRAAGYLDRIFKGAKPGDLPIQQASRFEFVINLKTAKALGLTIPLPLLLRADAVIE